MLALALLWLWAAPGAAADIIFCPVGSGAGQCADPGGGSSIRGLALDQETGQLYVADRNSNRIDAFDSDGAFLFAFGWDVAPDGTPGDTAGDERETCSTTCQAGKAGPASGQFDHPTRVAVDNGPGSPTPHSLYVVDEGNNRAQKLDAAGEFIWMVGKGVDKTDGGDLCTKVEPHTCGAGAESKAEGGFERPALVAVGAGGVLSVLDHPSLPANKSARRLQRFDSGGAPASSQCTLFEDFSVADGFAVDAAGNSWVSNGPVPGIRKFGSSCVEVLPAKDAAEGSVLSRALALDEAGRLFAAQAEKRDKAPGSFLTIGIHDSAGVLLGRFGYGRLASEPPGGLAVHSAGPKAGVFADQGAGGIKRLDLPPPGPIAASPSLEAPAAKVGSTKATLIAEVNPEGKATDVHFEYVDEATYLQDVADLGPGHGFDHAESSPTEKLGTSDFRLKTYEKQVGCQDPANEAELPGNGCLTPEAKYRWRVVATNPDPGEGSAEGPGFETKESLEIGDTYANDVGTDTARLSGEVNPLSIPATGFFEYVDDTHFQESDFATASKAPDVDAGAAPLDFGAGEAFLTRSVTVFPLQPGTTYHYRLVASNPLIAPVQKQGEEKTLHTFAPAVAEQCTNDPSRIGPGALLPDCRAYELVSPLEKGGGDIRVLNAILEAPAVLEQATDSGEKLAFGSTRAFGDALSAPFTSQYIARRVTGKEWETHAINPPRGKPVVVPAGQTRSEFKAFAPDLCDGWLITLADPPLAEGGVEGDSNLYRRHDTLCGGAGSYEALAPKVEELQGFSADGSRTILTSPGGLAPGGTVGQMQLYEKAPGQAVRFVCVLPSGTPVSGTCTAGSATLGGFSAPLFSAISEDGHRIFFSVPGGGEGKLYVRVDPDFALEGDEQTLEVSKGAEQAAGTSASWFWGAAADGSRAVFTTGNLGAGQAKLFGFEVGTETTSNPPLAEGVFGVMGMSKDAKRVYFASSKAISGSGQNSAGDEAQAGKANLYLYEEGAQTRFVGTLAGADETADISAERYGKRTPRITPDGAHAAFASFASLTGYDNKGASGGSATKEIYRYDASTDKLICASCNPSGARPAGPASIPFFETSIHAARALSDDGSRLYFESADRLAARDTNGKVDVYQWEELGEGGCGPKDAGFSIAAEGCIELLSSGQSPVDSRFVESDPSGKNIFFATLSSLLPQDYGLVDIYDARVDGGLPIPPVPPPPCEGDACQGPPGAPEAPIPAGEAYLAPPQGPPAKGAKPRCTKRGQKEAAKKPRSTKKKRCATKRKSARRGRAGG